MAKLSKQEPVYARSERLVPFCPFCGAELDSVDMLNYFSDCDCGKWSEVLAIGGSKYYYEPMKKEPLEENNPTSLR